jgi:hypothetical protein
MRECRDGGVRLSNCGNQGGMYRARFENENRFGEIEGVAKFDSISW